MHFGRPSRTPLESKTTVSTVIFVSMTITANKTVMCALSDCATLSEITEDTASEIMTVLLATAFFFQCIDGRDGSLCNTD